MSKKRRNSEEELRDAMKRVRTKKTIGSNKKRSKKHDETQLCPCIPQDLIVEILLKVPARSIVRLVLVSKLWSSIIRSKGFTELYVTRSSTRSRLLALVFDYQYPAPWMSFLKSFHQEDPPFDLLMVNIFFSSRFFDHSAFPPPVRGLICRPYHTKVMIGNPSTGQLLTLPNVKPKRNGLVKCFFGYDPVNDVYKVLCMTVLVQSSSKTREPLLVSEEHQVFTLGAKQKWRSIECKHHHIPHHYTEAICIKGVVYYCGWINSEGLSLSLVSFDLKSEEFNVIELPRDSRRHTVNYNGRRHIVNYNGRRHIVNYNGKIAFTSNVTIGTLNLWVLEDVSKQEWSKVSLLVPSWVDLVGENRHIWFRGTLSTGELIFSPRKAVKPFYYISFNLKENKAKKVVVEGIGDGFPKLNVYFDHVESPMIL